MLGRNADAVLDSRVRGSGILHLHGVYLESAHVDYVPAASGQMNKPFPVHIPEVRPIDFPILQHLCSGLRISHIAAHNRLSGNYDAAVFRDLNGGIFHRPSYAAFHIATVIEVVGADSADFRTSESVVETRMWQSLSQQFHIGLGNWSGTGLYEVDFVGKGAEFLV